MSKKRRPRPFFFFLPDFSSSAATSVGDSELYPDLDFLLDLDFLDPDLDLELDFDESVGSSVVGSSVVGF